MNYFDTSIVTKALISFIGKSGLLEFKNFVAGQGIELLTADYSHSGYDSTIGGFMYMQGKCICAGNTTEYIAEFISTGSAAQYLIEEGKEFDFKDVLRYHVELTRFELC